MNDMMSTTIGANEAGSRAVGQRPKGEDQPGHGVWTTGGRPVDAGGIPIVASVAIASAAYPPEYGGTAYASPDILPDGTAGMAPATLATPSVEWARGMPIAVADSRSYMPDGEVTKYVPTADREGGVRELEDMCRTRCGHPKVEVAHPFCCPGSRCLVDAGIAPLVEQLHDATPFLACQGPAGDDTVEFLFCSEFDAADFITNLRDYGRHGRFEVIYRKDHTAVYFPLEWAGGLAEQYRREWDRIREIRDSSSEVIKPHEPHPTVEMDGIPIDRDLAPLIRRLWDSGIGTTMCCQERRHGGFEGQCSIQFRTPAEAIKSIMSGSYLLPEFSWRFAGRRDADDLTDPAGCVDVYFPRELIGRLTRSWRGDEESFRLIDTRLTSSFE